MSDLKYKTPEQLEDLKSACEEYIRNLKSSLSGQQERLKWINLYIFEKTPQELYMSEIEARLGHKVIIKEQP